MVPALSCLQPKPMRGETYFYCMIVKTLEKGMRSVCKWGLQLLTLRLSRISRLHFIGLVCILKLGIFLSKYFSNEETGGGGRCQNLEDFQTSISEKNGKQKTPSSQNNFIYQKKPKTNKKSPQLPPQPKSNRKKPYENFEQKEHFSLLWKFFTENMPHFWQALPTIASWQRHLRCQGSAFFKLK